MGKVTKNGRMREKTRAEVKQSKQATFDSLPAAKEKSVPVRNSKRIIITEIANDAMEDDLELKVVFRLMPSKAAFSKVFAEMYFDGQKLHSCAVRIPQGPLSADELELTVSLDMRGINSGQHLIRVEMYELWNSEEKLTCTSKEVAIDYVPLRKQDRYIKIPIVRNPVAIIDVVAEPAKEVYEEIEKDQKKEFVGKRDEW
jgi:hypothetical protein